MYVMIRSARYRLEGKKGSEHFMKTEQREIPVKEHLNDLFELDIRIFCPLKEREGSLFPTQHDATCLTSALPDGMECEFTEPCP